MSGKKADSREMFFTLQISAAEYLRYYRGAASHVVVRAWDGRRLRFPAASLRAFVTGDGVCGDFAIRFDADHRLIGLRRLS